MPELVERWPAAVGEAIARHAWPARIARDGTLHVHTSDSIWAFELGHRAADIAGRVGVSRVRFAAGPLPEQAAPALETGPLQPTAREQAAAAEIASSIEAENLRETVQKAVSFGLARDRSARAF